MDYIISLLADIGEWFGGFTAFGKFAAAFCAAWAASAVLVLTLLFIQNFRCDQPRLSEEQKNNRYGELK